MFDEKILNDLKLIKNLLLDKKKNIECSFENTCRLGTIKEMRIDFYIECNCQKEQLKSYLKYLNVFVFLYGEFVKECLNKNKERFEIINIIILNDLREFVAYIFDTMEKIYYSLSLIEAEFDEKIINVELYKNDLKTLYSLKESYINLDYIN